MTQSTVVSNLSALYGPPVIKKELVVPTPISKSPAELFILVGCVSKHISPENVETPATLKLSKFV